MDSDFGITGSSVHDAEQRKTESRVFPAETDDYLRSVSKRLYAEVQARSAIKRLFVYDNSYWDKNTIDLGAAFGRRAYLRDVVETLDLDFLNWHSLSADVLLYPVRHVEQPQLPPSFPVLFIRWKLSQPPQFPTIVFKVDDFGSLRYYPFDESLREEARCDFGARRDEICPEAPPVGRDDQAALKSIRALLTTLIDSLSCLIAIGLHVVRAVRFFQTLILIEEDWFLSHGSHPPKAQRQAHRGLYFSGMCSRSLAA